MPNQVKNSVDSNDTASRLLTVVSTLAQELHFGDREQLFITLDSSFDSDIGFDSLSRVELLARIEKTFEISLPEQILATVESPRDYLRAIQVAGSKKDAVPLAESAVAQLAEAGSAPHGAATLVQVLAWHVENNPDRPHIRLYSDEGDGEVITYQDLWQGAQQFAAGLQQLGVTVGDSVLIMLPTGKEYFYSFFGIMLAGGVPVPLYPPGRLKQMEEHLQRHVAIAVNSRACLMITMLEAKKFSKLMRLQVESLRKVVTVEDLTLAAEVLPVPRLPSLGSNDTAFLQYTSGSTGMPKGVVLSHANLLANIRAMGRVLKVTSKDVFISWLPLYHDMGLIGAWFGSLYYACPLVVMPPLSFIARPVRWLRAIHRYGGTLSAAPNFAYELCVRRIEESDIEGLDLSSWRCAFNGAEAVSHLTVERFIERFKDYGFAPETMMPVYGLAESSVGLAFPPQRRKPIIDRINRQALMEKGKANVVEASDSKALHFVSCGQPLPGHQIRIVDDDGRELPERQEGRLQFRGPSSTSGYFRKPTATGDLFCGQWLDSGDMAYIAAGEVYITGRRKDIIIRAGRNIYPEELEEAIGAIEGIRQGNVSVFGSLDPDSGTERLIILAETRKRQPDLLDKLQTSINTVVNDLSGTLPDHVVLAPPNTVLKTSSGKIRRAASRKLYEQGKIGKSHQALWLQLTRFTLISALPQLRRLFNNFCATIYAAYCWLLFGCSAPLLWGLVVMLPVVNWRWSCMRACLRLLSRCAFLPVQVQGLQNLPPDKNHFIMVANHASYIDGIILVAFLPYHFSFVAKAELKDNFLVSLLLRRLGTEFVERFDQQKGVEDTRLLIDRGRAGRSILFFAEGTFLRMPGLLPFRMGAFEVAVLANLPVVPITLRGTRSFLRADSWFPRRSAIKVLIGAPYQPSALLKESNENHWTAAVMLRDLARAWILRHCGEPDLEHERPPLFNGLKHDP